MKKRLFVFSILSVLSSFIWAKKTFVGELLLNQKWEYVKLVQDSAWTFEVPYLEGDLKFWIKGNPLNGQWEIEYHLQKWKFETHLSTPNLIKGKFLKTGNEQAIELFLQNQLSESARRQCVGHYRDEQNNVLQIYERFNYLHIHSPYSREVMSLKNIDKNRFFCVSGEQFEFSQKSLTDQYTTLQYVNRNGEKLTAKRIEPYRQETVWIPIDRDSVYGQLFLPPTTNPKNAIVIFTGGNVPLEQNILEAEIFSSYDLAVLLFDKPGVGQTKSERSHLTDYSFRQKVAYYKKIIQWFQKYPTINPNGIGIHGGSEEGRLALMLAADTDINIAFTIAVSAPIQTYMETRLYATNQVFRNHLFSEEDLLTMGKIWRAYFYQINNGKIAPALLDEIKTVLKEKPYLHLPNSSTTNLPNRPKPTDIFDSLVEYLPAIQCPILLQYGETDAVVNVSASMANFQEAKNLQDKSTIIVYKRTNHSIMTPEQKIGKGFLEDKIDFLKYHGLIK